MTENRINELFKINYPLIQAGMIWCSGWELASAVSNAGGLGIIGSGSMYPEVLDDQIQKCKAATKKPFAVNLPLLYPDIDKHVATIIKHKSADCIYIRWKSKNMHQAFKRPRNYCCSCCFECQIRNQM